MAGTKKGERARRIERAKQLLQEAGWMVEDSASGLIIDKLIQEFGLADRRTARALEAKAARLLRGEAVDERLGRPREYVRIPLADVPPELLDRIP